jgi:hypothetical protein
MKRFKKQPTFFHLLATLMFVAPILVSCHQEATKMTAQEKETAQKEISGICNTFFKDAERLDVESTMKPYLKTSDFMEINPTGSTATFDEMKKRNIQGFKHITAFKSKTIREEFRFLTKNDVLYTWFGKFELALKTGEKYKTDIQVSSLLFSKINNEWKIVYDHTSGTPPIKVESTR